MSKRIPVSWVALPFYVYFATTKRPFPVWARAIAVFMVYDSFVDGWRERRGDYAHEGRGVE